MARLIGLCGRAGAGKDTVGALLTKYGYETYAMAGPLKAMLAAAGFPEPSRELKELPIPGFDFSYRKAAQALGTEWGRYLDSNLWVNVTKRKYLEGGSVPTVITDIRFQNEVEMVKSLGGLMVQVVGRSTDLGGNAAHASEAGIADQFIDFKILNTGSIEELAAPVQELMERLWWEESKP